MVEFIDSLEERTIITHDELITKINEIITAVNRLLATKDTNPNLELLNNELRKLDHSL